MATTESKKDEILDLVAKIITEERYDLTGKVFLLAGKAGLTRDPDFIELTAEIPVEVLQETGIVGVYQFAEVGEVVLTPNEVLEVAKVKDSRTLKNILTVRKAMNAKIIEHSPG